MRRLQGKAELKHDALIFINFDADSEFWSGVDLPWPLKWLANTRGLDALVREVKDLPNIRFTTLNAYLRNHPPVGTFFFSRNTAEGSFDGYNSFLKVKIARRPAGPGPVSAGGTRWPKVYPRSIDVDKFHPQKRNGIMRRLS